MKSQFLIVEGQPLKRLRRLQNFPPATIVNPPPPPQRQRFDIDGSFEPVGISEVPGEQELRTNSVDTTIVEIKELQADEFARNFNSLLTDLNSPVIIHVLPFHSPVIGVPMSSIMASSTKGMSYPTSTLPDGGVPLPHVSNPRPSTPATPFSPSSKVVHPSTSSNVAIPSGGRVVTGIPSAPFSSTSFAHTTQSGPIGSCSFV